LDDRSEEVLEYYDIDVISKRKGRGSIICHTKQGNILVREYIGTKRRMEYEEELLLKLNEIGDIVTDCPLKNKEDNLITELEDGTTYIVKLWFDGKECDVKNVEDVYKGAEKLAVLHNNFNNLSIDAEIPVSPEGIYEEYYKHNVELKRARNYIRNKTKKGMLELDILRNFDTYYHMAAEAVDTMKSLSEKSDSEKGITHGNYNYHNIIFDGNKTCIINFEGSRYQMQIIDLYNYLRKVMEKYQWDEKTGINLLESYDRIKPISRFEKETLKALISYPEKYWKVVNRYLNSSKSFIAEKNYEKISQVFIQQELKASFVLKI